MELNLAFLKETFFLAIKGLPTALEITFFSLLIAVIPAFFMALARLYKVKIISPLVKVYVSFIRGTPMVLQILIIYSLMPSVINLFAKRIGSSFNVFNVNAIVYAVTVFSLHTMATLSEVIRSSITTVDKGQFDASRALGMNTLQTFRLVILPQAAVEAIPNLGTLTLNLFKETSLCFIMTVKDITAIAKIQAAYGYNYIEAYIDIFVIYLLVCSAIQALFYIIERIVKTYKR